jgi:hypothetical protein
MNYPCIFGSVLRCLMILGMMTAFSWAKPFHCKTVILENNIVIKEYSTPSIESNFGGKLVGDLYYCHDKRLGLLRQRRERLKIDKPKPLVVFIPGPVVMKESYSMFAERMVDYGYSVVVLDHFIELFLGPPDSQTMKFNAVTSVDVAKTIEFMKSYALEGVPIDATTVAVMGHGRGGTVAEETIMGICTFPFCGTPSQCTSEVPEALCGYPSDVNTADAIKVGGGFGVTNFNEGFFPNPVLLDYLTNVKKDGTVVPFFLFNAEYSTKVQNEPSHTDVTYDQLEPTKGYAIGEGLDHFSLANELLSEAGNVENSSLPRTLQVDRAARLLAQWIDFVLKDKTGDFCFGTHGVPRVECEFERGE